MLGLGRNMALAIGRKGAAGFLEPIEDVPSGEFSDPDNPKIVEEDLPNGVEVSRVARSYNNSGNPPSTPPGLSGWAGNGQVTWTVTPGEGVDGIRLYDAEILPSRRSDESPDSNEASATPQEPTQPNTGSEWVVLEADSITGKSDDEEILSGEWPDDSGHDRTMSKAGSADATWRENLGPDSKPCVELDDGAGFGTNFSGGTDEIEVGYTYAFLAIFRVLGSIGHTDNALYGGGTSTKDALMYYNFNQADAWRWYSGGSVGDDKIADGLAFFDDWGLLIAHNDRTSSNTETYDGTLLNTQEMTGSLIDRYITGSTGDRRIAAAVLLKNTTSQNITDWEDYLKEKYGFVY